MSDQDLKAWLEDIDLEEYAGRFIALGVKKAKHLKDITDDDLQQMSMLPIEQRRFNRKFSEQFVTNAATGRSQASSHTVPQKVTVRTPTAAFGHEVLDINETLLQKEYQRLWYESPQNIKQKSSNSYILQMCSSAHWQFNTKEALYKWARDEREKRWNKTLLFMKAEELQQETEYFKRYSAHYNMMKLRNEYKDVALLDREDAKTASVRKLERLANYTKELKEINDAVQDGYSKIQMYINNVKGKPGKKEEESFWGKLSKTASCIVDEVQSTYGRAETMDNLFRKELSGRTTSTSGVKTLQEAASSRRHGKNKKKTIKRKGERSLLKTKRPSSTATTMIKSTTLEEMIKSMKRKIVYIPPIPCSCFKQWDW